MLMGKAISGPIFAAFLECETKAYLLQQGAVGLTSDTEALRQSLDAEIKLRALERLRAGVPPREVFVGTLPPETLRAGIYSLVIDPDIPFSWGTGHPDALERLPLAGARARIIYRPIRCARNEKTNTADKLALAFDTLATSEIAGQTPSTGMIIRGSNCVKQSVPIAKLLVRARSVLKTARVILSAATPPALELNKYCPTCQFQTRCRKLAIENDDLSLLPTMSGKARKRTMQKGISTVAQLSYTFRPPRRRRSASDTKLKHDPALKALAVRTGRIHIVGSPTLSPAGTVAYIDVEGIPDRSFYYLVGLRYSSGEQEVQRSFWADDEAGEQEMWTSCLSALKRIGDPCLIHYGSYETQFLRRMKARYCSDLEDSVFAEGLLSRAINLLSLTFARIYFPTYSNGLKEIAKYLGFQWSDPEASGANTLVWRAGWELSHDPVLRERLLTYNAEDCRATQILSERLSNLRLGSQSTDPEAFSVKVEALERSYPLRFGPLTYAVPEFQHINESAYWDYQRGNVYLRSFRKKAARAISERLRPHKGADVCVNRTIRAQEARPTTCPKCGSGKFYKNGLRSRVTCDLRFSRFGVRLWTVQENFMRYQCWNCKHGVMELSREGKYGLNLQAYVVYQLIELRNSIRAVARNMNALFGLDMPINAVSNIKTSCARRYLPVYENILGRIGCGTLVHADETQVRIGGEVHYVWVFTNHTEVAYVHAQSREAGVVRDLLHDFKGVLVSDFYSGYNSLECSQQKCLIHLLRDINEDVLKNLFNDEMRQVATDFANLLKPIIDTIDKRGLKSWYLHKHKRDVERFYRLLSKRECHSEVAQGWRRRFEKNRSKLFTFLDYDGVPWNNNNAEHAIKAFARLRSAIGSSSTAKGIREYLVLLSISETSKFKGEDFLGFLRSGAAGIARWTQH
ncbi:TM0106 family RecB-like putative nuclease [Methylobacterium nigriterrae]|uniref:TM0106 family RecB-like putative nuclease n=1 Tax=Methylobacterium nigriterrae TaxID=3127512 RepID=UPI003013D86D